MRLVLDTNVVISGLLWNGSPRNLLDAAIGGAVEIYTSTVLAAELREALGYAKFVRRLAQNGSTIDLAVERFMAIANLVASATIQRVLADPDDDQVLACALAAGADLIVSGDTVPLNLKSFHRIPIVTPAEALARIDQASAGS
jgi:putative PIN family toxin of toxin-antitoxin system